MKKKLIFSTIIVILLALFIWVSNSFIAMEFDITKISEGSRVGMYIAFLFSSFCGVFLLFMKDADF